MTAKIIQLIPRHHGPRCPMGFRFPGVYRRTGFSFVGVDCREPDKRYPHIDYTLDDDPEVPSVIIAEPTFTPIRHLDPTLDDGWIIVKHHSSNELALAYLSGVRDCWDYPAEEHTIMYETDAGTFTLLHRKARPTCENHLLIFEAYDPGYMPPGRPVPIAGELWFRITRANGELVPDGIYGSNDLILWPDED